MKKCNVFYLPHSDRYSISALLSVMRYIGAGTRSSSEVWEQLEKLIQHYEKHGFSAGNVYEKTTGKFVGGAGLIYLAMDDTQNDIEVAYALHKKFWNKGYATELARAFVK